MKDINALSVTLSDLELAAETGNASQDIVKSISSDLLYLFRQAQQLAAIPEQPITDAHIQMVIDSHEKGYAMIIPCKIDLTLALEVRRLRRAMNPATAAEDIAWWKAEAEDCKSRLLELAKEKGEHASMLRRWLAYGRAMNSDGSELPRHLIAETEAMLNQDEIGSWNNHQNPPTDKPKSELLQRAEKLAEDCAALVERVGGATCEWSYDDNDHKWNGKCGASWTFFEDGPAENSMHFCPGCGKPVSVVQAEDGE